ncbi:abortive infection system antitoxin AbiGi family protein [Achromobacter deleyi]|uniref:abortive infection system antitoxin AbiGi family protein n=1 Tax=Achromobacter deleyi TaxID=1353891 RepID=UPI0014910DC2|nr:abortive infection system antitoxin AbiGi family protein [Achromobacter deleyi]QVQ26009.1 hypothetical protein HLG70_24625 [Achromobacter deleyi]UIP21558.1 abortive infection system antitoxin AbiGi family protein [Achromobacter deleyi]
MAQNNSDSHELPFFERPDLTPFLVHLTKKSGKATGFENLVNILKTGMIRGSGHSPGRVAGPHTASCFMDVPLPSLKYVLHQRNSKRYGPYGVLISKKYAYKHGCRPVLYMTKSERKTLLKEDEWWRAVTLEGVTGTETNWLHEREWRAKGDFSLPSPTLRAVFVRTTKEAQQLQAMITSDAGAFSVKPRAILPLNIVCQGLPYME